jgi:hypothetical protein
MPPEDTYSVGSHPERFAPLHAVADALIDFLTTRYEAATREDPAFAADLMRPRDDVRRAVRMTPASPDGAPLTLVYTTYPGVLVHAGLLHDFPFPDCGCDACDETAESEAGGLEEIVMAVAEGRYRESYDPAVERPLPPGQWTAWPGPSVKPATPSPEPSPGHSALSYNIVAPDGSFRARGGGTSSGIPADRLATVQALLTRLGDGWQPWPLRRA